MSLLLAQPISRARVYATVAAASAVYVLIVAVAMFLGTWAGIAMAGVDVAIANLAWACALATLLGWFFVRYLFAETLGWITPEAARDYSAGLIILATLGFAAALLLMRCPVPAVSVTAFIGVAVSLGWAVIRK